MMLSELEELLNNIDFVRTSPCDPLAQIKEVAQQEHPQTVGLGETQRAQNVNAANLRAAAHLLTSNMA